MISIKSAGYTDTDIAYLLYVFDHAVTEECPNGYEDCDTCRCRRACHDMIATITHLEELQVARALKNAQE